MQQLRGDREQVSGARRCPSIPLVGSKCSTAPSCCSSLEVTRLHRRAWKSTAESSSSHRNASSFSSSQNNELVSPVSPPRIDVVFLQGPSAKSTCAHCRAANLENQNNPNLTNQQRHLQNNSVDISDTCSSEKDHLNLQAEPEQLPPAACLTWSVNAETLQGGVKRQEAKMDNTHNLSLTGRK